MLPSRSEILVEGICTIIDQNLGSPLSYFFYLHLTIRQKFMVLFHLFFLLCMVIQTKLSVLTDLFILFAHDHSTKLHDPLSFILSLCTSI